jgi:SAM-dependent methyltransferase/uncharacterized protein YbaR (Trm112 family)
MTPYLLQFICEPITNAPLDLVDATYDKLGNIITGALKSAAGAMYPIVDGVPRFANFVSSKTVDSFGDEWNHFNFIDFKANWLAHTVANTFGGVDAFKGKLIVDAGGGSGSQTKWFAEYGAKHVILLDLSHSVDDVVRRNLAQLTNVDVIQCSIDAPPLRSASVDGIVYCHNVIQHTPSVEKTAAALFDVVAPNGEFVFNCYALNDQGPLRWVRFHLIYKPLRRLLSKRSFKTIMAYSRVVSFLRLVPVLGEVLEKLSIVVQGDVPVIPGEEPWTRIKRRYKTACLNTFDCYGSHEYQHHKSDDEIRQLVMSLQPDASKVLNADKYYLRPPPIGCALRIFK